MDKKNIDLFDKNFRITLIIMCIFCIIGIYTMTPYTLAVDCNDDDEIDYIEDRTSFAENISNDIDEEDLKIKCQYETDYKISKEQIKYEIIEES